VLFLKKALNFRRCANLHRKAHLIINADFNLFSLLLHEVKVRLYYKSIYDLVIKNHKIDHVFLLYIDDFTYSLSLFGSPFGNATFSGISMRQQFHLDINLNSSFNRLILKAKKYLFLNLLKQNNLKYVFIIDPKLKDVIELSYKSISQKIKYFADPVNDLKLSSKIIKTKF
jgi:hypothetical protein